MKKLCVALVALSSILFVSCLEHKQEIATGQSAKIEMEQTETNQMRLAKDQPPPQISRSQERENLINRLKRLNQTNMVGYVYLFSYGKLVTFYTVKGKVSSLNSLLTTPVQIVDHHVPECYGSPSCWQSHVIQSPDFDGSLGKNDDCIFFFTADSDAYVEWHGDYLFADQPLKVTQPPELVVQVQEKK